MKKFVLLLAALLFVSGAGVTQTAKSSFDVAKDTEHHIVFDTLTSGASCSATAVGPHTLVTAAHCMIGTAEVNVDGKDAKIVNTQYDERDHELMVLDGVTFDKYVQIDERAPNANEVVFMWGYPGNVQNPVYRVGQLQKTDKDEDSGIEFDYWTLPVFPGDSGSGLISQDGKVISVVSVGNQKAIMGSTPFAFTSQQLAQIK